MSRPGSIRPTRIHPPRPRIVVPAVAFGASMLVIAFGVIGTSGTYGSRLGLVPRGRGAAPGIERLLVRLAITRPPATVPGTYVAPGAATMRRVVFVGTLVLAGAPAALAGVVLMTYGVFVVAHAASSPERRSQFRRRERPGELSRLATPRR